jgi:hypothetical protein
MLINSIKFERKTKEKVEKLISLTRCLQENKETKNIKKK